MQGKRVLITGGSSGIGLAAVKRFIAAGATVISIDMKRSSAVETVDADCSVEREVADAIAFVAARFDGVIDVLINNAGVGANLDHVKGRAIVCQTTSQLKADDFGRVMANNCLSAAWLVKHAVAHMPKNDSSVIISASSIWSRGKLHYAAPYTASKAALSALSMSWAYELAPIRSVGIVIGGIDTPMLQTNPNGATEVAEQTLLRRPGTPEEVAEAYYFAAACRYLTATEIVVDGGSFNR